MDFLFYQNTIYFLIFAVISGGILLATSKRSQAGSGALSAKEAIQLSNTEHAQFIDIRSPEDFKKASIPQSKNFPKESIEDRINALPKKPLILVGEDGRTAQQTAQLLKKKNIEQVFWIQDGLAAWRSEGLPLKSSKS
ncbi:rhodanese-like domain-containing protein [Pelistega sp. NLN82]|uniref:Rhodanese-like domain-containing protein n=1 Tax=Pelistega ratti TaxID=2652177 RepID=A0A6L9Y8G2_9BURK|nr:rhodanese-like domain-containing protein [Pelistega ratti]NEN76024.1 rhodanese-like domain-containing protein [Pelistega ratti]